jgi:transposase InsO family protein
VGLIHHSDRGVQYGAHHYRDTLRSRGITVSMSRQANCYDNGPMESANGTIKVERVHDQHYATRQEAIGDLTHYIGARFACVKGSERARPSIPGSLRNIGVRQAGTGSPAGALALACSRRGRMASSNTV